MTRLDFIKTAALGAPLSAHTVFKTENGEEAQKNHGKVMPLLVAYVPSFEHSEEIPFFMASIREVCEKAGYAGLVIQDHKLDSPKLELLSIYNSTSTTLTELQNFIETFRHVS